MVSPVFAHFNPSTAAVGLSEVFDVLEVHDLPHLEK